jgi:hypothetical protein
VYSYFRRYFDTQYSLGILSMSAFAWPQGPNSGKAGYEIVPFQDKPRSAPQTSPHERRNVRIPGAPNLIITGRISEQIR